MTSVKVAELVETGDPSDKWSEMYSESWLEKGVLVTELPDALVVELKRADMLAA